MSRKPQLTLEQAMAENYKRGGPSQIWFADCQVCAWRFSGRAETRVIEYRNDHLRAVHQNQGRSDG